MAKAKVFMCGNSQAVRLPKEFRFTAKELTIERRGAEVVLTEARPKSTAYGRRLIKLIQQLPDDMIASMERFEDYPPQAGKGFE